jgi:hypothetical protein
MKIIIFFLFFSFICLSSSAQDTILLRKHPAKSNRTMPSFQGDIGLYLMKHIVISKAVKGQEIVQFLVNTDGSISQFKIINSLGPECDIEVLRVLSAMPKWNPGKEDEVPVPMWYNLPILINQ